MPSSEFRELYAALVCGQSIASGEYRRLFLDTGLIHLLVVSGAHLHFIDRWMQLLPARLRLALLGVYCWLTGFGAPVVRAWLRRFCDGVGRPIGLSPLQTELFTLALLLALIPDWLFSRSFLMCWLCALAMTLPPLIPKYPTLSLSLVCYVLLWPFCPSAPITILCNVLVTPFIGALLFPLSALAAIVPCVVPLTDQMWRVLLVVLDHFPTAPPAPIVTFSKGLFLYPLTLHLILLIAEVPWRRARAFSSL